MTELGLGLTDAAHAHAPSPLMPSAPVRAAVLRIAGAPRRALGASLGPVLHRLGADAESAGAPGGSGGALVCGPLGVRAGALVAAVREEAEAALAAPTATSVATQAGGGSSARELREPAAATPLPSATGGAVAAAAPGAPSERREALAYVCARLRREG